MVSSFGADPALLYLRVEETYIPEKLVFGSETHKKIKKILLFRGPPMKSG